MLFPGSALEGGAVFEGEGQAAIRVSRGVVQQAAPELLAEGGDLAVLLLENPEEVLHRAAPVPDIADLLCDCILLGLGLLELLADGLEALVVFGLVLRHRCVLPDHLLEHPVQDLHLTEELLLLGLQLGRVEGQCHALFVGGDGSVPSGQQLVDCHRETVLYTEPSMNGFREEQTPVMFDSDDYNVLIVANKYQTGFDQKKLCAMYVLKKLKGVNAVQTYSQNLGIEDTYVINNYPNKNYSSSATLQIINYSVTNQYASAHITSYALVKVTSLPPLGSNHYITNATLHFSPAVTDLFLREITGNWSPETVKWTNRPSVSSIVQDYDLADNGKTSFNVTGLIRKWYEGDNKGVQISNEQLGTVAILQSSESSNADNRPYLSVEYASLAGLEDYLTYDTVSAGKAGTGHVSLANGNLIFSHSDTVMNGARMPVSVTHVYNSCDADKNEFFCGYGWRTNFHQTLHKELLNETIYYVYTDGDGTEHWFKPDENSGNYKDESGLSMELTVGNLTTIRDKGDNVLTFPLITATPTITQPTAKVLVTSIADACGNRITVTADGMKITMLTDGAIIGGDPNTGRKTKFEYENDLLVGIRTPWQGENDNCIRFSYASQRLTGITYEDGNSSSYSYYTQSSLAHRLLTKAVSPEGIRAEFTYENLSVVDGLPHVVRTAKVSDGQANDELVFFTLNCF